MVLQFLCPNGHKIHCPDDRAGKAAKCPKCAVKFEIPTVFDDADAAGPGESLLAETDSVAFAPSLSPATEPAEDEIEFLCPNGHHLHGPADMQGQLGQCPDCGAEFRIPSAEESDGPEEQLPDINFDEGEGNDREPAASEPSGVLSSTSEISSLSRLFARLWAGKSEGVVVELHLGDGQTVVPERYAEELSQGSHAVFSASEPDGTHTLSVVAWESITRVVVRGIEELPEEMQP